MALESPATYAEWYWKNSMDAKNALGEQAEKTYGAVITQIMAESGLSEFIPKSLQSFYSILAKPPDPDWAEIQRFFLPTITRAVNLVAGDEIARPFLYASADKNRTLRMDAETVTTLQQRKKITDELFFERMHTAGYADSEIAHYYNARLPYPSIPDIITYARYQGDATNPKEYAWSKFDIPENDWALWDFLSWQQLNTEQVLSLYRTKFWDESKVNLELARLGWRADNSEGLKNIAYELPNPMLLVQGSLVRGMREETIIDLISRAGIHPHYAADYLDGILTKPSSQDIIAYELRRDPSLSNLGNELTKTGIHSNYLNLYKELAYEIPPVADIITMAVREAFTPDIAARFGQYEGLPSEYVSWVQKKGLSKEWAERYWAAHWSLPSPQQGFEMLHRGIINRDDLFMLLRALDIMPFWRDKMVSMAYTLFTRVDIRRMYNIGVLNADGVHQAYMELGYDNNKAGIMTQFTVKLRQQALEREKLAEEKAQQERLSHWTAAQTLSFLKKKLITPARAESELILLGYNTERIRVYLASAQPAT